MIDLEAPWVAYKLRWNRRKLLWRAWRKRHEATSVVDRTNAITRGAVLGFATVRNETLRLPYFLQHHRELGVGHFLFVDNASTDGTADYLAAQPDVSLWRADHSYKAARFGMDWQNLLLRKYGHGHWCLTLDADELFVPPHHGARDLQDLTHWLDTQGKRSFGALMVELFPKGALSQTRYVAGEDPVTALPYFDADNYRQTLQPKLQNLWVQGGVRARYFFADAPAHAPTMSKIPLVRWSRGFAYVSSTHTALPRSLNRAFGQAPGTVASGALLHTKFLHTAPQDALEEKARREHFGTPERFDAYYDAVAADPDLWHAGAARYAGWQQLEALGLMSRGDWD